MKFLIIQLKKPELILESSAYVLNKIFKELLTRNNIFPVGQCFEDSAVIYNVLYLANKITCVEENLYYYQINRDGSLLI